MTTYNSPAIREAIIEVRPKFKNFDLARVKAITQKLNEDFPIVEPMKQFTVTFKMESEKESIDSSQDDNSGIVLRNNAGNRQIQITSEHILMSWVNHYSNWDEYKEQFESVLQLVSDEMEIKEVDRIGVRFVNDFNLPISSMNNLSDYISHGIDTRGELGKITNAFARLERNIEDESVIITHAATIKEDDKKTQYILDIDVFDQTTNKFDEISAKLDKFRNIKNQAFESSITQKLRDVLNV